MTRIPEVEPPVHLCAASRCYRRVGVIIGVVVGVIEGVVEILILNEFARDNWRNY